MPLKGGRLTAQERIFAETVAATGDKVLAARQAGFAQPARDAGRVASRETVQVEIARIQTERLFSEALPAAVNCLVSIITSDRAPAGARVQASKVVLDRTLGAEGASNVKEPHEMTGEELARAIAALESVAASRAKPVEAIEVEPERDTAGGDIFA